MNIYNFNPRSGIGYANLPQFRPPGSVYTATPRPSAPAIANAPVPSLPHTPAPVAPAPAAPAPAAPAQAPPSNVQNLLTFGGDRKTAIETLIASGAKGENPKVGFFGNVVRKIFGGTKTSKRAISPNQTIATKVRVKNFGLKELRLTTRDGGVTRHVDFTNQNPAGGTAQVKDIGTVIAKGQVKRMFDQKISRSNDGRTQIENNYYDPKTGHNFLRTTEKSTRIDTTKLGTVHSKKKKSTTRQIEVLGTDGKADQRYTFDYRRKSVRLENLDDNGQVRSSYRLSKKTDFFDLVDRLSTSPPSGKANVAPPFVGGFGGGGGRGERFAHVALH